MTSSTFYHIDDFRKISMSPEFIYNLPSSILTIINELELEIGKTIPIDRTASYPKKSPVSSSTDRNARKMGRKMDEPWETQPVLKKTVLNLHVDGIEKKLSDVRVLLNKISTKTYEIIKENIISQITEIAVSENKEDIQKIVAFIFDIASSNKFYSELYAQLYKELIEKFPLFKDEIHPYIEQYLESINAIVFVDQNTDYDAFCLNNKKNEKRKTISTFMINLLHNGILEKQKIMDIIIRFQTIALQYMDEENRVNEIEEITENLFLLITMAYPLLMDDEIWKLIIVPNIETFVGYKVKDKKSYSSRALFKQMDIRDKCCK